MLAPDSTPLGQYTHGPAPLPVPPSLYLPNPTMPASLGQGKFASLDCWAGTERMAHIQALASLTPGMAQMRFTVCL